MVSRVCVSGALDRCVVRTFGRVSPKVVAEVADHDDGPIIGACMRAEAFLSDWQDDLPFGRPMAP